MSNVSKTSIDNRFQAIIENQNVTPVTETHEDISVLAYGACRANTNFTANAALTTLPILSATPLANGQIIYVDDMSVPITVSGNEYIGLDGRKMQFCKVDELYGWGCNICGSSGVNNTTIVPISTREATNSTNWTQAVAGHQHTVGLKSDGSLWTWGINNFGQLGTNNFTCYSSPVREATSSTNWCQITAGSWHTAAIKTDGSLWTWGSNICGQLGDGTVVCKTTPTREGTISSNWCQVSAGNCSTAAIKTDGSLWSWGWNACGKLGTGTTIVARVPVREATSSSNWYQVSVGGFHTLAIKKDGSLWGWGWNVCGQLGDNSAIDRCTPVRETTNDNTWCQVSAGYCHSVAIKSDGSLWMWGNACFSSVTMSSSPVREATNLNTWKMVSAGFAATNAITCDGILYAQALDTDTTSNAWLYGNSGGLCSLTGGLSATCRLWITRYFNGWKTISLSQHENSSINIVGINSSTCIPGR